MNAIYMNTFKQTCRSVIRSGTGMASRFPRSNRRDATPVGWSYSFRGVIVYSSRKQVVWAVAAWATLVAPAIPQACECPCVEPADTCGRSCCAPETPAETCCCQLDVGHAS